ncbi:MAG: hypothetical protein HZA48_12765 [Planctomycetes bacterium]|nr:hypothetical protein [Planctomycetota bacterium]
MNFRKILFIAACVFFPFLFIYPIVKSRRGIFLKIAGILPAIVFSPAWIYSWVMAFAFLAAPSAREVSSFLPAEQQFFVRFNGLQDSVKISRMPLLKKLIGGISEDMQLRNSPFSFDRIIDITGESVCISCRFHAGSEQPSMLVVDALKFKYYFLRPLLTSVALPASGKKYAVSQYQGSTIYEIRQDEANPIYLCFMGRTFAYSNDVSLLKEAVSVYSGTASGFTAEMASDNSEFGRKARDIFKMPGALWFDFSLMPADSGAYAGIDAIYHSIPVHELAYPLDFSDVRKAVLGLNMAADKTELTGYALQNHSGSDPLLYDQLFTASEYTPDYYKLLPANSGFLFSTKIAPLNLWDLCKYWAGPGRVKAGSEVPNEIILAYNTLMENMNALEEHDMQNKLIFALDPDVTCLVTAEKYSDSEDKYYPALTLVLKCSDPAPVLEIFDGIKTGEMTAREDQYVGQYLVRKIKVLNDAYSGYVCPAYCVADNCFFITTSFPALNKILQIKMENIKSIYDNRFFGRVSYDLEFDGFASYFVDFRQYKKIMYGMEGFAAVKAVEKINRQELRGEIEQEERERLAAEKKPPGAKKEFDDRVTGLFEKRLKEIEYDAIMQVRKTADSVGEFGGLGLHLKLLPAEGRDYYITCIKAIMVWDE